MSHLPRRRSRRGLAVLFGAALSVAACEGPPGEVADGAVFDAGVRPDSGGGPGDAGAAPSYTIAVLPDTQYYASSWPSVFMDQARWLVDNHDAERIAFVLHTGDIVDSDVPAQWQVASQSLHLLDGVVPYVIAAGNHDYANLADRMGMGNVYFPPSGFAAYSWFGGTFEPGHIENSFSLIPAGGGAWVVLSLEFGPRDEVLAWADSVLKVFADRPAIVITHAYLYHDSTRYDHAARAQNYNPHNYVMMGQAGTSINDGEEMWTKLVAPNPNVKLVFSGHDVSGGDLPPGTTGFLSSTRSDGSVVYQILANYQTCTAAPCEVSYQGTTAHGGYGYLRLLRFSPAAGTISVSTYSPTLDASLTDAGNQFDLTMN